MRITFVAHNNKGAEQYKIFELNKENENPFWEIASEGEQISIENVVDLITSASWNREPNYRNIRRFCLDAIVDNYTDIRYYQEH